MAGMLYFAYRNEGLTLFAIGNIGGSSHFSSRMKH